jgi:hypothetical protein
VWTFSLLALPAAARAEQLDVKTGQWEMTATVHLDGPIIPPEALANLPPQVRAQIDGALQSAQRPHTNRSCITEDKLRRGLDLDKATHGDCHQDLVDLTGRVMEMRGVCQTPDGSSTMHATITAVDRDTLQGLIDVDRAGGSGPRHIRVALSGKWLGPNCDGHEGHD